MNLQQNPLFTDLNDNTLFTEKLEEAATSGGVKESAAEQLIANTELLLNYFQLFPNPSSGLVNLQASLVDSTPKLTIQLLSSAGRLLYARNHRPTNGTQVRTQLNLSHLRAGSYTLVLETAAGTLREQIVIEK
ncbi:MAG: T9SS type A sorting domain-containing protein [Bacteroidota bacterium]